MSISALLFGDTETTDLKRETREIWNYGFLRREPDGSMKDVEVIIEDVDLAHANEKSLQIGHFYERHPRHGGDPGDAMVMLEADAVELLREWVRPYGHDEEGNPLLPHLVGMVPHFDDFSLWKLFARYGYDWTRSVHYHLADVETLAVGYLARAGKFMLPPWSSTEIVAAIDVAPPPEQLRHTALGDADWAMRIWDRIYTPQAAPA